MFYGSKRFFIGKFFQFSWPRRFSSTSAKKLEGRLRFSASCEYSYSDERQSKWNILVGWKFNKWYQKRSIIGVGWRYNSRSKMLELTPIEIHGKTVRFERLVLPFKLNTIFPLSLSCSDNGILILRNNRGIRYLQLVNQYNFNKKVKLVQPSFKASWGAPHNMKIWSSMIPME